MIAYIFFSVPIIGWALREAVRGGAHAKTLFLVNCLMLWALAVMLLGYPAIILTALAMTAVLFVFVFIVSWPYSKH
ncbi:MAG: hypothetical protein KDA48_03430 [Amphiplicatus sp.]|nr:hypothetical protein [Amphiplicatus sp.]HRX38833.1 hypothetical protein [Parvularculaceae bacterium]